MLVEWCHRYLRGSLNRTLLAALLMFVFAVAGIELSRHSDRIASVWFANGAVLAVMLRSERRQCAIILAAAAAANVLANLGAGDALGRAAGLAACNALEIALAFRVFRTIAPTGQFDTPRDLLGLALAGTVATLASATLAMAVLQPGWGDTLAMAQQWFLADLLGLLIVTPVAFALSQRRSDVAIRDMLEPAAFILLSALATAVICDSNQPRLFLLAPLLLFAGFRLRPAAAILAAAASAAVIAIYTIEGVGPIAQAVISVEGRSLLLQAYVAVTILLTLPVSTLTRERDTLMESLVQSEAQQRLLADNSTDIILRLSLSGRLLYVSRAVRKILGYDPQAMTGTFSDHAIHPDDLPALRATFRRVAHGEENLSARYRQRRQDGTYIWLEALYSPIFDERTGEREVVAAVRDITARVVDEQRIVEALDQARAAGEAKSGFLATMSHEIRTPMTGVLGMIELLRGDPPDAERDRYLATLNQSARLLMAVLDDILDFSKMEHGSLELRPADFDLEELAQSTLDLFFNAASQKGLLISLAFDGGRSPLVRADPIRLQQVMSNLINNAIKFTETGSIRIRVKADPLEGDAQRWRIEVRDTGIGIDAAYLSSLFDPFSQGESGNGRRPGGTGLGLAISRKLVESMGGAMGVDSTPGEGSTFWFELVLAGAKESVSRRRLPLSSAPTVRPLDVLVAEDNPVNQLLISALLRRQGHRPTCVANGEAAVEAAGERRFDCILMDMQMPVMDGISATRTIRASGGPSADTPIIALTADASPERRRFYDNGGLTGFMTKPIDDQALAAELATIAADRAPSGAGHDALDIEQLERVRSAIGPTRFVALIDLFLTDLDSTPDRIRAAVEAGDHAAARSGAHGLKGAALSLGATRIADAAKALEQIDGNSGIAAAGNLLDQLQGAVALTRSALAAYAAEHRGSVRHSSLRKEA